MNGKKSPENLPSIGETVLVYVPDNEGNDTLIALYDFFGFEEPCYWDHHGSEIQNFTHYAEINLPTEDTP
ncbi:MAG: hypothetical protein JWM44_2969 [Bacilli bacterium]|nr:hypothetical protein [Bacilli bacterium]